MAGLNRRGFVAAAAGLGLAPSSGAGTGPSEQAGAGCRALPGGRRQRSVARLMMPRLGRAQEADRRHRQQGRRERDLGQRHRRRGAARWLHAAGEDQRAHHQPLHQQDPALRHRTRLHAGDDACRVIALVPWPKAGFDPREFHDGGARQSRRYMFGSTENTTRLWASCFARSGLKIEDVAYKARRR